MNLVRGPVDGDVEIARAPFAVGDLQFEQVLDVYVNEAETVVLEALGRLVRHRGWRRWQSAQALSLEDAVDAVADLAGAMGFITGDNLPGFLLGINPAPGPAEAA